jgi:UDP-glucose 4-epimerase
MVTGAAGRNGSWVCRGLSEAGHDVIAVDAQWQEPADDLQRHAADIRDTDRLTHLIEQERVEAVAHLAAALAAGFANDPAEAFDINVGGTLSVLRAAVSANVRRVVFSSSLAVYRPFEDAYGYPTYERITENYPRGPMPGLRLYGASKIACEECGAHFHEQHGVEFVALRFPHILGAGRSPRQTGTSPEHTLIDEPLAARAARMAGGDERADFLYIKDLAYGVERALVADGDISGAYNIGSGELATLSDIAAAVRDAIPTADITVEAGRNFLGIPGTYGLFDIGAARAALGYQPRYGIRSAVQDYIREAQSAQREVRA